MDDSIISAFMWENILALVHRMRPTFVDIKAAAVAVAAAFIIFVVAAAVFCPLSRSFFSVDAYSAAAILLFATFAQNAL